MSWYNVLTKLYITLHCSYMKWSKLFLWYNVIGIRGKEFLNNIFNLPNFVHWSFLKDFHPGIFEFLKIPIISSDNPNPDQKESFFASSIDFDTSLLDSLRAIKLWSSILLDTISSIWGHLIKTSSMIVWILKTKFKSRKSTSTFLSNGWLFTGKFLLAK